jgi:hypothetical protein
MENTQEVLELIKNNAEEVLALIEELGLSLLSTTQEQSTN